MRAPWRTGGIAIVLVTAAWASTARAGSSTTMQVDYAWDNRTPAEHDVGSLVVTDLNDDGDSAGYVRVWAGLGNWWEARHTDPYPGDVPDGAALTSVVVTVQYNMENAAWNGALILDARKGAAISLGTDSSWPEQPALAKQTWDITALVNAELDPLNTLNLLRIRMINNDSGVNVVWDFCEVAVQFEVPPDKPSITSPAADATGASRTLIVASAFSDADGNGTHQDTDWEVYDDAGLAAGNRVAYSLADATNKESIGVTPANVTFENSLNLETALLPNTEYWARVRYRDTYGLVSEWSDAQHFTTGVGLPPTEPVVADPGSPTSRRPSLTASAYSDPEGDAHALSDWEVFEDVGLAMRVASSLDNTSDLTSITIDDSPGVVFENALAGTTSLAPDTDYWARVTYRDEYGATSTSAAVGFTTTVNMAPDVPSITSPSGAGVSRRPSLTAGAFSDPEGDVHASSDWEVFGDAGLTMRVASSLDNTSDLTSITIDDSPGVAFEDVLAGATSLAPDTDYWVQVTYRDEYGATSTSAAVGFTTTVNLAPDVPSITSPSGAGVSRSPTVTASGYNDQDFDAHASSDWEVFGDLGLTMRVASSLDNTSDLTSITIDDSPGVVFENALAGTTSLAPDIDYWVQVTYRDQYGAASTSAAVGFTTTVNMAPDVPFIASPSGAGASRVPTITANAYNDQDFDPHASSDWEVFDADTFTLSDLVASSMADTVNLTSIDVNGGTMLFQGSLAGRSSLEPLTDYWVRVTYRDAYGGEATSAEVQFKTVANAPPAQPVITSPAADEDNAPLNPVIAADAYSDPDGDAHSATYWEVHDNPTLTSLVAAGGNPAVNLTSIEIDTANVVFSGSLAGGTSLEPSTDYWVVVTYRDGEGADSEPSAAVHFTTGNYPEGEEWPFFGSGCSRGPGFRRRRSSTAAFGGTCLALCLCAGVLFRRRRASL